MNRLFPLLEGFGKPQIISLIFYQGLQTFKEDFVLLLTTLSLATMVCNFVMLFPLMSNIEQ